MTSLLRAASAAVLIGLASCAGDISVSDGTEKTLFVAAERKPCTGVAPMECLQVREAADRPWQYFYSEIEGFTHEPGYTYELRVLEQKVAAPPADGSSLHWRLLRVVSKRPASGASTP